VCAIMSGSIIDMDPSKTSLSPISIVIVDDSAEQHRDRSSFHLSPYKVTHDEEPKDDVSKSKQEEGGNCGEPFVELHDDVEPEEGGEDPEELSSISLLLPSKQRLLIKDIQRR
jgi:hypothetical protein